MHSVTETLERISQQAILFPAIPLSLTQAAGRVLATPVRLTADAPPFDRSQLDGFAVRAADARPGARLRIIGRLDAGVPANLSVAPGTCVAINTGAPMPPGAETVVMIEHTTPVPGEADRVQIDQPAPPGRGISRQGSDARAGDTVLPAGTRLGPAQLAVAAAAGAAEMQVYPTLRVAVLTTGDELVPVEAEPGPAQIRNTNQPMLEALVREAGALVVSLGAVPDDPQQLRAALARGLEEAEVLVVTGGMSMGTRDWVPPLLLELGVTLHVEKVRIKPGKPFLFGTRDGAGGRRYVLGLPGNPVSGYVCFQRFGRVLLGALTGASLANPLRRAICPAALPANGDREFYQPATLRWDTPDGHPEVHPLHWKGSADLFTLARADALIVHPPQAAERPPGSVVDILPLHP